MAKRTRNRGFQAALLVAAALALAGCNAVENKTQSNSMLLIDSITGLDLSGKQASFTQSDVLYVDPQSGASSIADDVATVVLSAKTIDPDPILGTSQYENIRLDKFVVSYTRSDGANREGVDVPYSYEAGLSALIEVDGTTTVNFIIVRASAKQEPPLVNLLQPASVGQVLYVTARIDFYGHDIAGKTVTATGYLPVEFSNFINN